MMLQSTVYILDPHRAQFRIECVRDLTEAAIEQLTQSDSVDSIAFDGEHALYFDDCGLKEGISHYTLLEGYPDPLVGILVLAPRKGAPALRPTISLAEAAARFQLFRPVMDPIIKSSRISKGDMTSYISAVDSFTARIEQVPLQIIDRSI